ncbi:MAG: hypothetical protein ACJ8J0_04800, partial [Longimicrobiaceae bacterium]
MMIHLRRSPHLAPGSAFLAGLLLALLGLSGVLAYQAADAARSEARSTDRALRGYASVATWELARRADDVLRHRLAATLQATVAEGPDAAAQLAAQAGRELAWCACAQPVRGAFTHYLPGDYSAIHVSASTPAVERWLRAGLPGSALDRVGPADRLDMDTTVVEPVTVAGERYLVAERLLFDRNGLTRTAVVVREADFAPAALDQAYRSAALLPDAIRGSVPPGDAVTAAVLTADGTVLWSSRRAPAAARDGWVDAKVGGAPEPLARGTVTGRLDGLLAGLTSRVAVRAEVVGSAPADGSN